MDETREKTKTKQNQTKQNILWEGNIEAKWLIWYKFFYMWVLTFKPLLGALKPE